MAFRLYLAAVCKLTPEEIADQETGDDPDVVTSGDAVRKTISEWSRTLDIPVPPRRRGRRRNPDR
jgi:hypothetical protein